MPLLTNYPEVSCLMPDSVETSYDAAAAKNREGHLEAVFQQDPDGRTYLARQYSSYPFHICRAQYLDKTLPDMASLYLQSCSGGIFRNDRLSMRLHGKENARVHVTTQASTIVHRMEEGFAQQQVEIVGEDGCLIEYVPDSIILFPLAKLRSSVLVTAHPNCDAIVCDSFLAHDPNEAGESFSRLESELVINRPDGRIVAIDRFRVSGDTMTGGETSNTGLFTVHGSFAAISSRVDSCALESVLRSLTTSNIDIFAGVSRLPNNAGCWVRYMAVDGIAAKKLAIDLWQASRTCLTGSPPDIRRK
jgi:urease accessory protein